MWQGAFCHLRRLPSSAGPLAAVAVGSAAFVQPSHSRWSLNCEPKPIFGLESITRFFKSEPKENLAPLVICGPSGVGKGTLIKVLQKEFPDSFGFSVSSTTRKPRPGEVDGKDYHFIDRETFDRDIAQDAFVEHAKVHTNQYGTSKKAIDAVKHSRKIAILDIDIQGAQQVKSKLQGAHFMFLAPPSMEILEARLRGRGTEKEEKIQVRMKNAREEMEFSQTPGFFELVIVADEGFKECLPRLQTILREWYPQLR